MAACARACKRKGWVSSMQLTAVRLTQGIRTQLCICCDPEQPPCKGWGTGILNQMRADQELLDLEICARDQSGAWVSVRVHTLIMVRAHTSPHTWRVHVHAGPDEH